MASERVEVFRKKMLLIAAEAPSLAFEAERKYYTRKARQSLARQRETEQKKKGSKSALIDDEAQEAPEEEVLEEEVRAKHIVIQLLCFFFFFFFFLFYRSSWRKPNMLFSWLSLMTKIIPTDSEGYILSFHKQELLAFIVA